ncbi:MAG: LysM peptidoglycan-binding domain-containing protein [Opitutaceae bacterium]|jgi:LysM repeat protein
MKLSRVLWALLGLSVALGPARAQSGPTGIDFANLQEDVRLLTQRVGDLQIRVEQIERENNALKNQAGNAAQAYATVAQLNDAVADLNNTIKTATAATQTETLRRVSLQMEKLAKETQAAIDALAKNQATRPAVTPVIFSEDYPKEGVSYTVQRGDTLAAIAKKIHASVRDIINANKIADPSRLMVGQTIFIPQAQAPKN